MVQTLLDQHIITWQVVFLFGACIGCCAGYAIARRKNVIVTIEAAVKAEEEVFDMDAISDRRNAKINEAVFSATH